MQDIIVVDGEGNLSVEGADARMQLRGREGRYRLASQAPGVLILRRELPGEHEQGLDDVLDALFDVEDDAPDEPKSPGGRVLMAGEILNSMTLFQIIEVIGERNWQGDLRVFSSEGISLELTFDQGALVHARSDHEEDRLGELLLRQDVVTKQELTDLLWEVSADRRLGQVCLEKGLLDRERLFGFLRNQVEGIFHRTLLVSQGGYVFSTPDTSREQSELKVHLPVRALLMVGIQRIDELELFRDKIPNTDVCLEFLVAADVGDLDETELTVLAESDGETPLSEVAKKSNLDQFAVIKAAYHLVKRGFARVRSQSKIDEATVRRLTSSFSEVLDDVFTVIAEHGDLPAAQAMLAAWVSGSGYDSYFGEDVAHGGSIDAEQVLDVLRETNDEDPMATFHHIGHELVGFALFCAGSVLPREEERKLSHQVNRKLQEIRR